MEGAQQSSRMHVRFDPDFLTLERKRVEEKKKLLKRAAAQTRAMQSFVKRVANQANQQSLALAVQGIAFRSVLTGLLDLLSIPPNINLPSRLYSTAFDQHAGNFDLLYDNNGDFGSLIRAPDGVVEDSGGGPFSNVVTPENSPGRGGNNAGNGGQGGAGGG